MFLNNDETVFAVQAHAIASTLRDDNGRLLPLYFQIHANVWYHPVIVYLMAACFTVLPVVEWLKSCLALVAGLVLALVPLVLWLPSHAAAFYGAAARYDVQGQMQLGFATNLWNHATVFVRFFDPLYLFVRDRGAVTSTTGRAGVFALSMAVLLPLGMYEVLRWRRTPLTLFLLAGFFSAPIAATFVNEAYTTDRALMLLPFGALIGTFGLERLLTSRARAARITAVALVVLIPAQFAYFYLDYLTNYRLRSAFWFNGNNRSALEEIIAADPQTSARPVYLADNIPFIPFYWKLYLIKHHREDLLARTVFFNLGNLDAANVPADSLILTSDDAVKRALIASGQFQQAKLIFDPDGTTPFARLEKRTAP